MQGDNRTVVGIFSDITDAKKATDELHGRGVLDARLVENDQAVTFTGTAEREGASRDADGTGAYHKSGGIKGFFARLFGLDDDRPAWQSSDSESYFQAAYDKKHHLVIIEDCTDVGFCREIITRMGGVAEEQGSHHYHTERGSQRSRTMNSNVLGSATPAAGSARSNEGDQRLDVDTSLDSGRRSSFDQAADSGLGVDVDRMPFAHPAPPHGHSASGDSRSVSDRISQSRVSGTADHIPFSESASDLDSAQDGTRSPALDRSSRKGFSADADQMPFAGQSSDVVRSGATGPGSAVDAGFGTGVAGPSPDRSFAGDSADDNRLVSADRTHGTDRDSSARNTGRRRTDDRALDGISGDADRTPLVGQTSTSDRSVSAGQGSVGHPSLNTILVGDERIHDRGVSNADVARLSSDRIMEVDGDDQALVDADESDTESSGRRAGSQDQSIDNGHILPGRSAPSSRPQDGIQPGQ